MEIIDNPTQATGGPVAMEMTPLEQMRSRIKYWFIRQRRKLPHLVWWGEEVDVTITFSQHGLPEGADMAEAMQYLYRSRMAEIEAALKEIGISFDRGGGYDGRDWEWDWSLKGPVSVRFRERSRNPHLRRARPGPCLVVSN